jgi:hypothetical protein
VTFSAVSDKILPYPMFKPKRIIPTRWIDSAYQAEVHLFNNHNLLVEQLTALRADPRFKTNLLSKQKAKEILDFLLNKNAMAILAVQLDIGFLFKGTSLEFQKRGQSFLGQTAKKKYLLQGIQNIMQDRSQFVRKILTDMKCLDHINNEYRPCASFLNLEASNSVKWHGKTLLETPNSFESVSTYKNIYLEKIKDNVEKYMPDDRIMRIFTQVDEIGILQLYELHLVPKDLSLLLFTTLKPQINSATASLQFETLYNQWRKKELENDSLLWFLLDFKDCPILKKASIIWMAMW